MKLLKLKNLLAIACIIFISAAVIQSCSKKDNSTPVASGPTVTSITPSGDTVGTTSTFTIAGSNLTGASVTTTATGVTLSSVTATATSITGTIAIGSTATAGPVTLTVTTSAGSATTTFTVIAIPLLGGYTTSDSVAAADLIAYWPMDGNVNDIKGGIAGTPVNVTFVPGVRGQAYQGDSTAYASFTPSAAMATLQSFSVSVWYWEAYQPLGMPAHANAPQGLFFLADANGADPLIILEAEHYVPVSGDSLQIHAGTTFTTATNYKGFTMVTYDTAAIGKWVHFVMTYNGGTSTYIVYQDGLATQNSSAYGLNLSTVLLDGPAVNASGQS